MKKVKKEQNQTTTDLLSAMILLHNNISLRCTGSATKLICIANDDYMVGDYCPSCSLSVALADLARIHDLNKVTVLVTPLQGEE